MKQLLSKLLLVAISVCIAIPFANAQDAEQTRTRTGTVVDKADEPAIGVTVLI